MTQPPAQPLTQPPALRAVCLDFQDTLACFEHSHDALYVQAAREHGVELTVDALAAPLDDAWAKWRTPLGIDHSAASKDRQSFRAVRLEVHRYRFRAAGVDGDVVDPIVERLEELESQPEHYRLFDDVLPALDRLARAGVAALVVSNHLWELPEIVRALGLGAKLEGVLTSARVGYRKPHPAIYAAALRLAGCDPSEVLFVGDNPESDVDGPRAAGMCAVLLDRAGTHEGADVIRSLMEITLR
jgi:putative hydrolase of the HAD superfamily